jgi:superfamily II DNA helicase RecQ
MTSEPSCKKLHDVFGYAAFRGEQQAIVEHVVADGD